MQSHPDRVRWNHKTLVCTFSLDEIVIFMFSYNINFSQLIMNNQPRKYVLDFHNRYWSNIAEGCVENKEETLCYLWSPSQLANFPLLLEHLLICFLLRTILSNDSSLNIFFLCFKISSLHFYFFILCHINSFFKINFIKRKVVIEKNFKIRFVLLLKTDTLWTPSALLDSRLVA